MKVTDERLREIREREQAATAGPWRVTRDIHEDRPGTVDVCDLVNDAWVVSNCALATWEADGRFIAAARVDVPDLLDDVAALRAQVATLRDALTRIRAQFRWGSAPEQLTDEDRAIVARDRWLVGVDVLRQVINPALAASADIAASPAPLAPTHAVGAPVCRACGGAMVQRVTIGMTPGWTCDACDGRE